MNRNHSTQKNVNWLSANINSYNISPNDDVINVNTSLNAVSLYLPNIQDSGMSLFPKNFFINDVGNNAGTNNITIYGVNNTINGGNSQVLDVNSASAQCVINGQTEWLVNKSYDGGGNSTNRVIAKLENINLKDELSNVLQWVGSNLANNTAATQVVVKPISGSYVPKVIPETPATTTIVFDDTKFPSNLGLYYSIRLEVGPDIEIFNDNIPTGFATNAEWMDFVKQKYEDASYGVVINGLNMQITGPSGTGETLNTLVNEVASRDENAGFYTDSLSSSPPFSGGTNPTSTNSDFTLDGDSILIGGSFIVNLLPSLTVGVNVIIGVPTTGGLPIFKSTGNYALPVTTGTLDDFIISIFIYGDTV